MLDLYLKRNFYSPTSQHFSFICKSLLPLFSNNHNRWVGIFHTLILSFAQQAHDKCTEHIHETKTWMRNSHGCYIAFFFYFNISSRNAFEVWQIIWIFDIWIWSTVDVACIICSKHTHTWYYIVYGRSWVLMLEKYSVFSCDKLQTDCLAGHKNISLLNGYSIEQASEWERD